MKLRLHIFKFFLLATLITVMTSLACSTASRVDTNAELQHTAAALAVTQTYFERPTTQNPTQLVQKIETDLPTPFSDTPPPPIKTPDVNYEGIRFSFDDSIAESVQSATIPEQNLGDDFLPGGTYPTHFEFSFNQYAITNHTLNAKILIYPVEEYREISTFASDQINALAFAIINRPGGSARSTLPFLPLWPAAQLFSAQVSYFDFQNGSGVRFLTMFGQDIFPIDNFNLIYTYQGMTHDGRYYLSVVLPISHPGLPDDGSDLIGEDYVEFYNSWDTYLPDTLRFLGEQMLDSYFPSIVLLDELIKTIEIYPYP